VINPNVVDFQSDYEYMLIAYNSKPTLLLKTTDKEKIQSKMSKIRMIHGMVRTNLQRAVDLASYLLGNYTKKSIVIVACSKPMLPLQFPLSGAELKVLTPYTIRELDDLNQIHKVPAGNPLGSPDLRLKNASQSNIVGNQTKSHTGLNGGVVSNTSIANTTANVQAMNAMLMQNQMNSRQQVPVMNTAGLVNQQTANSVNQSTLQQIPLQQVNQQSIPSQQQQMGSNSTNMNLLNSQLNMSQNFQQPFDLQSNQFLESQKQQHQQHMARNNAIAGGNSNFLMNNMGNANLNAMSGIQLNNMNAMLAQNMMMNQQRPNMVNMSMANQRQPSVIWTGHLSWVLNTQAGMQPVEIQCGVTAMSATHQQNPTTIDD
jgi:hypothetical protein